MTHLVSFISGLQPIHYTPFLLATVLESIGPNTIANVNLLGLYVYVAQRKEFESVTPNPSSPFNFTY